jgi:hypothetical protein
MTLETRTMDFCTATKQPLYLVALLAAIFLICIGPTHADDTDWPREVKLESGLLTIYQPQVDGLKSDILTFRAAVSFKADGSSEPVFGAAWFESRVEIDRVERTVHMLSLTVADTRFPNGSGEIEAEFDRVLRDALPNRNLDFSLDDLLTSLEAAEEQIAAANDLNMDPPTIIYRDRPAMLILLDGDPVLREIENSSYKAVINTPYPLILDTKSNTYYLNAGKAVWYQAKAATGPFAYLANPPSEIASMVDQSEMEDSEEVVTAANAPELVVSTEPAELIVTEGKAQFQPLVDDLLVISNSASDVFMHVSEQGYYIVLSGRWFKASSMQGPWAFVQSESLPATFQSIPEESNQAESRVYVAGTDEAREAVMDAQIPQTAAVQKGRADIEVTYDGDPRFVDIAGVSLKYAENTGFTVIQSGSKYYVVEDAVWYVSSSATGPWDVAESRPDEIGSIPSESPVYNVKYVYIYETTPEVVYVGYTPGYTGSYVYHTTVVYGTGWYYRPWVTPYYYYPRQATWGFHVTYNPWTGWGYGLSWGWGPFRIGFHSGGYWHRRHHWHHRHHGRWGAGGYRPRPVHFGNNNINIGNINVNNPRISQRDNNLYRDKEQRANVRDTRDTPMNRDNQDRVANRDRTADRSQLDRSNVSQRPATRDVASTRNNTPTLSQSNKQNNVFTDKQGNVYRNTDNGWQQRDSGSWKNSSGGASNLNTRPSTMPSTSNRSNTNLGSTRQNSAYQSSQSGYNRPSSLDRQNYSRQRSSTRTQQYSRQRSAGASRGGRRR